MGLLSIYAFQFVLLPLTPFVVKAQTARFVQLTAHIGSPHLTAPLACCIHSVADGTFLTSLIRLSVHSCLVPLNGIDILTQPLQGHVDFSWEVSRSLTACQGALLVVDASQGIQAQSISVFHIARERNLKIIPVLNKVVTFTYPSPSLS